MSNTEGKWRDRLWKDGLSKLAEEAVEFFMPDLAADRDASQPIMAIVGPEVQDPSSKSDKGMRVPDVFISVPVFSKKGTADGEVALFVEQQHEHDKGFTKRIYDTYKVFRGKHERVTALAIFTGRTASVGRYRESFYGTSLDFRFNTYSVRDVEPNTLRADERVFANVALAARLALDAGKNTALREAGARELLDIVSRRSYSDRTKGLILKFAGGVFHVDDAGMDSGLKEAYKMWKKIPMDEYIKRVELENAREEGEEIGMAKGILTVVRNMLADNMPLRDIARLTGMKERDIAGIAGA